MTTYSYDRENRLISQNVDGNVTSFAYDGFGRKRRESRGVNPDVILNWDGDQMIVESSDLDPEAPSKAYYVADGVIYAENANLGSRKSRRDYAVDFLGSVTGLTDIDSGISSVRRWSAYGKLLSGSAEPIGYFWTGNTGSRVYQSLGLNDNRARHYGRNIKQWITRDPLWPSELPYAYVGDNPVTRIDPSGMKAGYDTLEGLRNFGCTQFPCCVSNTKKWNDMCKESGKMFECCASKVSAGICILIGGLLKTKNCQEYLQDQIILELNGYKFTLLELLGEAGKLPAGEIASKFDCQNSCMRYYYEKRSTHLTYADSNRQCKKFGVKSKECCVASFLAEQKVYEECAKTCKIPELLLLPYDFRIQLGLRTLGCCDNTRGGR
jgi:RHS repeat-associated protein